MKSAAPAGGSNGGTVAFSAEEEAGSRKTLSVSLVSRHSIKWNQSQSIWKRGSRSKRQEGKGSTRCGHQSGLLHHEQEQILRMTVFYLSGWMKKTDPWAWNVNYFLCLCYLEREEILMNSRLGGNARGCAWRACILPGRSAQGTSAQQSSESTAFMNRDTDFCAVCKKPLKIQAWWPLLERKKNPLY